MRPELADYIRHYIRKVIGLSIPVEDSPDPCAIYKPRQVLQLPISEATLGEFLGEEFVANASRELLFSIVVGLAYHESAHLLSGEANDTKPAILNNVICDSNDFNFTPQTWPGSIPFTISLNNTTYQQSTDLKEMPLKTKRQKLSALLGIAISFMRKRRVRFKGKDVRSLPKSHALHKTFEKIKPIAKEARKTEIKDRPKLVKQLFKVLKDYWTEEEKKKRKQAGSGGGKGQGKKSGKSSASDLTPEMVDKIAKSSGLGARKLSKADARELQKQAERNGVLDKYKEAMKKVEKNIAKESVERMHSCIEKPYDLEEQKETSPGIPAINESIVGEVRNSLRPILFQRTIKRMAPSVVGERFSPSHFHEIKTNPREARVRKTVKKIARVIDETSIVLCFDRSGSMAGEKEEITIQIASTLYKALSTIPRVKTQVLGFDDVPQLIKGRKSLSLDTVLRRIPPGLSAQGGTNFSLALKECLRLTKETPAHKKLVIILTDGDLRGEISIEDLLQYADTYAIKVICIGVQGSDELELREYFDRDRVIYVERIHDLPAKLKQITLSNI